MIDLTVKTLDSQNHAFSLVDDITVREFKEHIAETVSIPADCQRLIYCGRVLQDEKHLSEYDVNGKVIHLVQRVPPTSAQRGGSGQSQNRHNRSPGDQPQSQRTRHRQARAQFHGNPMYLGSFSIPTEVVDGSEWPVPLLSNTLSSSRLVVARRMLDQANRVLDRLENPSTVPPPEAAASERHEAAAASGTGDSTTTENSQQDLTVDAAVQLMQPFANSPSVARVIRMATAMAGTGRPPYAWPMREGSGEGSAAEPSAPTPEATSEEAQAQPQEQQQTPQQASAASGTEQPGNERPSAPAGPPAPRPPEMAQLLQRLIRTQSRLRPFLEQYCELMEQDPVMPGAVMANGNSFGTVEENQRIADGVTECFHFLSHANHALSDIIVDVSQAPPRNLRCRPMIIQQAILQAGIPIQVEARISVARNDGSNAETPSAGGAQQTEQQQQQSTPTTQASQQQPQQQQQQQQAQSQPQMDSPFGAIFNITDNMEVLMEMGPPENSGSPGSNAGNATGNQQSQNIGGNNNNNNNNAPGTSGVAGIFPWGPVPPPEIFRNLIDMVAGYMAQGATTVTTVATTSSTATPTSSVRQRVQVAVGSGAAPNPAQSTQARSNVGTHPTTSTQTRSTARPHVFHPHAHPLGVGMGMGQNMDFDPFLPCHSHHIRRPASATPPNTATARQPQSDTPTAPVSLRDELANLLASSRNQPAAQSTADSVSSTTLESLLLARGLNNILWDSESFDGPPHVLQRFFSVCAAVPLREWFALINSGRFQSDAWSLLRRRITSTLLSMLNAPRESLTVGESSTPLYLSEYICELSLDELRPYYTEPFERSAIRPYDSIDFSEGSRETDVPPGRRIDLVASIERVLRVTIETTAEYIQQYWNVEHDSDDDAWNDENWGKQMVIYLKDLVMKLVNILRYALLADQPGVESAIRNIARLAMEGFPREFRDWVLTGGVVDWFVEYSRRVERLSDEDIVDLLVFEDPEVESPSRVNTENSAPQETTQTQPEPEPMETEEANSNRAISDPLDLDDGQEVPTSFPGHEALLPEWVPIIARDEIRQRRQLQLQGSGVTPFSDAYLDGLPSKRRKLVEQQKPRLLVSPTPNHSSIPASMERLVRENTTRAGVEEVEGAAAAVAADPAVRRAFGQAIRECLSPQRLQTPDFPDARRFPNATKYFAEKDTSSKQ